MATDAPGWRPERAFSLTTAKFCEPTIGFVLGLTVATKKPAVAD